jgi:predicted GH43/DUF377 family glycosyl hydrolase
MLFERYKNNPIISPDSQKKYESRCTYNPAAIVHDNKIFLIYRAEGEVGKFVSRLCLAISDDGYNFKKYENNPIIEPSLKEEKGGCEDPRIVKIDNTFYLTYTSYNGMQPVTPKTVNTSLAVSYDLIHWEKKGIIVKGLKSTVIFSKKINDKYLMFIGGKKIRKAWSKNLINWDVNEKPILDIRENEFDSIYIEVGPPPFIYKDKLVLFFNTTNKDRVFQPSLALLDQNDPTKVLYRANKPIMTPIKEYELNGHVSNVIFGEGLVEFKETFFFYYGAADKYVGVATVSKKDMEKYITGLI